MNIQKILDGFVSSSRWLGFSFVLLMLLSCLGVVRADSKNIRQEITQDLFFSIENRSLSGAPVAVDDGGPGFTTDEDHSFYTNNVLKNDSDSDRDTLFISDLDLTSLAGRIRPVYGTLDTGFDLDGVVTTNISSIPYFPNLAIQDDGKTILVGSSWNSDITSYDFMVFRFNPDGSLDHSFEGDGVARTDFGWTDDAQAVAIQPDKKIIVAGQVYKDDHNNLGLARYNPDGSLDISFNGSGKVITTGLNVTYVGSGLALQADGKIVAVGTVYDVNIGYMILVTRFNTDGSLDLTFGGDGIVTTGIRNNTNGYDVVIQTDQKILVSGFGTDYVQNKAGIVLVRYLPDGTLDHSFNGSGILLTDVGPDNSGGAGRALVLQPDHKIVVTGNTNDHCVLARYNTDGSLDASFGINGIVLSNSMKCSDLLIQPTKEIVVVGTSGSTGEGYDIRAIRYRSDGTVDTTFGDGGMVTVNVGDDRGSAAALGSNGTVTIAGIIEGCFALARIHVDGVFFYEPGSEFDYLKVGEQATDTFTYTISDGVYTDTARVNITITGEDEFVYLPSVMAPIGVVFGWVTDNGVPAQQVALDLRFYNGTNWFTVASTTTGPDGKYTFIGLPGLGPGQIYYVRYNNQNDPNHLWLWATRELTHYSKKDFVNIGNFDISNVDLLSPKPGSTVTLPFTFQWKPRLASLQDSYEFNLFDPRYENTNFFTDPPLGYVDRYRLTGLPPGFVNKDEYAWNIGTYSPDGGFGVSFYSYIVKFVKSGPLSMPAARSGARQTWLDLEIMRNHHR